MATEEERKQNALQAYRKKLMEHREVENRVRTSKYLLQMCDGLLFSSVEI